MKISNAFCILWPTRSIGERFVTHQAATSVEVSPALPRRTFTYVVACAGSRVFTMMMMSQYCTILSLLPEFFVCILIYDTIY
jgi:hypothetical protein